MYKIYPKTLFIGQKVQYLPSCHSTNDEAADLIANALVEEGIVVVTDHQTAGRGQRGNQWDAEPGQNLTFSLVVRPVFLAAAEQFWLNMAVSLGIIDALEPLAGAELHIKWPNDIYIDNQKLGGLLIENTVQGYTLAWSVIGIGLNVNQTTFAHPAATSLQARFPLPTGYDLRELLTTILESIERRYLQLRTGGRASGNRDTIRASYLQRLFRYQEEHFFRAEGTLFKGIIIGVDDTGRLAIQAKAGVRYFGFKEVEFMV
ncbi:MAG: biotin--[acetyl-CoA-carboxylase] ligase [Bacteroidetes bacterium]|nr:biotin--[acetyl-CoA-carboxylase] ligase [Fibrella sp.]